MNMVYERKNASWQLVDKFKNLTRRQKCTFHPEIIFETILTIYLVGFSLRFPTAWIVWPTTNASLTRVLNGSLCNNVKNLGKNGLQRWILNSVLGTRLSLQSKNSFSANRSQFWWVYKFPYIILLSNVFPVVLLLRFLCILLSYLLWVIISKRVSKCE